jgi:hypothetical protein
VSHNKETAELWHQRFGHLGYANMAEMVKHNMTTGINISAKEFEEAGKQVCAPCVQAKHHKSAFPTSTSITTQPMQLVHMDVCGPLSVDSIGGKKYIATFLDNYSGLSVAVPVARKSEVPGVVRSTLSLLENLSGCHLRSVRTDRGSEYLNDNLKEFFNTKGVSHQTSSPYTPEQNGSAERLNRTLMERVRAMLIQAKLDKEYWAEAVVTATSGTDLRSAHQTRHHTNCFTEASQMSACSECLEHARLYMCRSRNVQSSMQSANQASS